jgi:hypothetical protein
MKGWLHEVSVSVVGLHLHPVLSGDSGGDLFVWLLNLSGKLADFGKLLSFDAGYRLVSSRA